MKRMTSPSRTFLPIAVACAGGIALIAISAASAPPNPPTRPTTRTPDCTSGGCHADQTRYKFLHAPTAAGACDMCHVYADDSKHTFTLKHQGAAMCDFCHIGKTDTAGLHVHEPVTTGECTKCHNPHGSEMRNLMSGPTVAAMCLACHESVAKDKTHLHTPINDGDCLGCHRAHSSVFPKLVVAQGRDLCLKCHADVATAATPSVAVHRSPVSDRSTDGQQRASNAIFMHEPFKGECSQCHDPHGSNTTAILTKDIVGLCTSCHEDVAKSIMGANAEAGGVHSIVTADRACLHCHTAHHSQTSSLLIDRPSTLCLDCHKTEVPRRDGTKVASLATLSASGQHLHGALQEDSCNGCHNPHGTEHRALLTQPYTQSFYQTFDMQAYGLCFSCHDSALATEPTTRTATGFRNGEQNLHWLHVTAPGDAGRSCRACHTTHSASNAKQLADAVPFGEWKIPIQFQATATGGTCGAGCHRATTYDRETPPGPAGSPAAPASPTSQQP